MAFAAPALAALPVILGAVSTGVSILGIMQSTSANIQAANYQAQIADRNAAIMEDNAQRAAYRSAVEAQQQDENTRGVVGQIIANQAASGLRLGGRSAMLTRKSAAELGRLDTLNIRQAGEIEAHNYLMQAEDFRSSADFSRKTGQSAAVAGALQGFGSLVGGLGGILQTDTGKGWLNTWQTRALATKAPVPAPRTLRFS